MHPGAPKCTRFFTIRQNEPTAPPSAIDSLIHPQIAPKMCQAVPECAGMCHPKKIAGAKRTRRLLNAALPLDHPVSSPGAQL
jgi:hypothetical protein